MLFTMMTLGNFPYACVGDVFSQILSGHFYFTFFIGARNHIQRARMQVFLFFPQLTGPLTTFTGTLDD